jgi:penicillin-binding protein 2
MLFRLRIFRRFAARQERDPIVLGGSRRAELRDHQKELHNFQLRLAVCAGMVLLVFFLLVVRFFYVQVLQHDYYLTLAENNRISIVPIIPNRGLILDRNGAVLAHNYAAYTLEITPAKAGDLEPLINELATVVEVAPKDRKRFRKLLEEGHDFASLPIRTRLNDVEVAKFAANKFRFPGVDIRARLFRHYPNGDVASHVIGYIGRLTQGDLDKLEDSGLAANYTGSDYIGKVGLEGRYEADLHGTTGFEEVETDANGRAVRTLRSTLPVSGNNLLLSLDARLQEVEERVFGDRRGALVAIEPSTGGILGAGQPGST